MAEITVMSTGKTLSESMRDYAIEKELQNKALATPEGRENFRIVGDAIRDGIIKMLSATVTVNVLDELIETGFREFTGRELPMGDGRFAKQDRTGAYGTFLEDKFLGLGEGGIGSSPFADIEPLETEIKSTLGARSISVGLISISDTELSNRRNRAIMQQVALTKMLIKMKNLLYIHLDELLKEGKWRMGIKSAYLFTTLLLEKIERLIKQGSIITIEPSGAYNPVSRTQQYQVRINVEGAQGLEKVTSLYLHRFTLIDEGIARGITRKAFWKAVKTMNISELKDNAFTLTNPSIR